MPKKPGLLNDPWRKAPEPLPVPRPAVARKRAVPQEDRDTTVVELPHILALQNYGGLSLIGGKSSTEVLLKLLDFCVEHRTQVEDTLADFGIVVAQLNHEPKKLHFYLQREDGWTLAVPEAPSRDYASVQIIQAVLTMQSDKALAALLSKHKLSAYKC